MSKKNGNPWLAEARRKLKSRRAGMNAVKDGNINLPNPSPARVAAQVVIQLTEEGKVNVQYQGPPAPAARQVFNMMMETAKQDLVGKLMAQEQQSRLVAAPPIDPRILRPGE